MKHTTKKLLSAGLSAAMLLSLAPAAYAAEETDDLYPDATRIVLNDKETTVNGEQITEDTDAAVYMAAGSTIVHYDYDMANTYGSKYGEATSQSEWHTTEECDKETHIVITEPGTYVVSGTLYGQLSIEMPKKKAGNEVKLVLDGVDITCDIASGVLFTKAYEYDDTAYEDDGIKIEYDAAEALDYESAGAYVVIADGTVNNVTGSHVAKCYAYTTEDDGTVTWTYKTDDDGNPTTEQKKLAKYDGAFYSKVSMTIAGESEGTGVLNITADNEGLDSEQHLVITGGTINITSCDDGINTNNEGGSVTMIKGGTLRINATRGTEGDGIDSNGYLIIDGGTVYTCAKPMSDSGMDADNGIIINGGTVVSLGSSSGAGMDSVSSSCTQPVMTLSYSSNQAATAGVTVKDADGNVVASFTPSEAFGDQATYYSSAVISSPLLQQGSTYTVYSGDTLMGYTGTNTTGGGMGGPGGMGGMGGPGGMGGQTPPENADGTTPTMPDGSAPTDMTPPDGTDGNAPTDMTPPDGTDGNAPSDMGGGFNPGGMGGNPGDMGGTTGTATSKDFTMTNAVNTFTGVQPYTEPEQPSEDDPQPAEPDQPSEDDPQPADTFKYVDDNGTGSWTWASEAIYALHENGTMVGEQSGDGYNFYPNRSLTRAEAVVMILALKGIQVDKDDTTSPSGFSDADNSWYTPYVAAAKANKITAGYEDGTFQPDATISRAEFVTMLMAAEGITVDKTVTDSGFSDVTSGWYVPYVAAAKAASLTSGDEYGHFNADAEITRAEAAVMAYAAAK